MATYDQVKEHWDKLLLPDEHGIFEMFERLLSGPTKTAILNDLSPHIDTAYAAHVVNIESSIRGKSDRLPDGNPLKDAIEGVV